MGTDVTPNTSLQERGTSTRAGIPKDIVRIDVAVSAKMAEYRTGGQIWEQRSWVGHGFLLL